MRSDETPRSAEGDAAGETRRPRRRGEEVERAVLRAAVDELTERGYGGFTMDRVAARAGTNKTAIYRRWPSRPSLAFAAYRELVVRPDSPPDTGDLRSDVIAVLRLANDQMNSPANAELLRDLMIDARREPGLIAKLRQEITRGEPGIMLGLLARAASRGEVRPEALHPRIASVPVAMLRNEFMMNGSSSISDDAINEIVDLVFMPLVRPAPER